MKFSSRIEKSQLSPIRKFYPYQVACNKKGIKIYHLNIGQPDIQTPPAYFEAIRDFSQPVLEYAPSPGIPQLIQAVQGYYSRIGIDYGEGDILVTTGGSEALQIALSCILDTDDEILIPEPFYPNYNTFVNCAGGKIVPIPTTPEEGYHYADRERIEPLITPRTRAIMISNPGNPTGVVLTPEQMRMIADIAKEHGLFLIADEVYREFIYGDEPLQSMGAYRDLDENLILIDSVSKRFSACGARIGVLITRNQTLQQHALKICQARLSVATLDQVASAALYQVDPHYFDSVRAEYRRRRDTIYRKLQEIPGVVCKEPQGAFYVMAKLPVPDTDAFQTWLLTEFQDNHETIMYAPGGGFFSDPALGKTQVRFAYVLNCQNLERAMDLLKLGIAQYNGR
ncbi:MAG: pyridoxal phosphate-dependent aminotransferase [Christensenellales bacterium]|jgi:aspartate aminotransferase|nr:pyridoxal phosphate-dependent aminotransferase [Christensenellales bacterium]